MKKVYSVYEAKAKFSEILRLVRERGATVTITHHGEPVAEIRPVEPPGTGGLEARIVELEERGAVVRASGSGSGLQVVARRAGALQRFLAERD